MIGNKSKFEVGKKYRSQNGFVVTVLKANQKSIVLDCYRYGNDRYVLKEDEDGAYVVIRAKDCDQRVYASQEVA